MNAAVSSAEASTLLAVEHHTEGIIDVGTLARWQAVVVELGALREVCRDAQVAATAGEWLDSITRECGEPIGATGERCSNRR